mmetsp:Transcript_19535/g.38704  ORF Transcript_19535/g.38704 Transcript_19535/m.38704 type:complete len:208 (-) Transcript_19535:554-1177(-)
MDADDQQVVADPLVEEPPVHNALLIALRLQEIIVALLPDKPCILATGEVPCHVEVALLPILISLAVPELCESLRNLGEDHPPTLFRCFWATIKVGPCNIKRVKLAEHARRKIRDKANCLHGHRRRILFQHNTQANQICQGDSPFETSERPCRRGPFLGDDGHQLSLLTALRVLLHDLTPLPVGDKGHCAEFHNNTINLFARSLAQAT